jgi:hypothetical protein
MSSLYARQQRLLEQPEVCVHCHPQTKTMKMTMRRQSARDLLPFFAVAITSAIGTSVRSTIQSNSRAHRALNYFKDTVVDGLETEYNEYAQSWRYLGLYVDCQQGGQQQQKRHLAEGEQNEQCGRYLLWAAVSICFCANLYSS